MKKTSNYEGGKVDFLNVAALLLISYKKGNYPNRITGDEETCILRIDNCGSLEFLKEGGLIPIAAEQNYE